MRYPYLLYSSKIDHKAIFKDLTGDPFMADLSPTSPLLEGLDVRDQKRFQAVLNDAMAPKFSWGLAAYLERRDTLLADCPQMMTDQRFIHLGLDVIVDVGTPLHAPLEAIVRQSGYEEGEGNYGGYVLLQHESPFFETFFSFYGHLCTDRLPSKGQFIAAGAVFAQIGDFHENGNWFYHTHLQVITSKGLDRGYVSKGYCAKEDLMQMDALCPSPLPLFKTH